MNNILQAVSSKVSHLMWGLIINGIILVILAVLIAWSSFLLQLLVALMILVVAFSFFYGAHKLHLINKIFKK